MKTFLISGDRINDPVTIDAILAVKADGDSKINVFFRPEDQLSFQTFLRIQEVTGLQLKEIEDRDAFLFFLGSVFAGKEVETNDHPGETDEIFTILGKEYVIPEGIVKKYQIKPFQGTMLKKRKPRAKSKEKTAEESFPENMNPPTAADVQEIPEKPKRTNKAREEKAKELIEDNGKLWENPEQREEFRKLFNVKAKEIGFSGTDYELVDRTAYAIKRSVAFRRGPMSFIYEEFGEEQGKTVAESVKGCAKELQNIFR